MAALLSLDNPVFSQFAFYASGVLLKTMCGSFLTTRYRLTKGIFANPEDCKLQNIDEEKTTTSDPDVERVRRCHLNDIENVIPFVLIGQMYVLTDPDPWWASLYFRAFAGMRLMHTIAYLTPLPQPSRLLMFLGGWGITFVMGVSVLRAAKF